MARPWSELRDQVIARVGHARFDASVAEARAEHDAGSDYERGLTDVPDYPAKRVWWDPPWRMYQWPPAWPIYFGGDEFGRRTVVLHLPLLGRIVVACKKSPGALD